MEEMYKENAVKLFNKCWDYLDKEELTVEDEVNLVASAHSSLYAWSHAGNELNLARGEWMVANVYSRLNQADLATHHAQRSLDYCLENGYKDFDLAFAYEALARAAFINNDENEYKKNFDLALDASKGIEKEGDKEYFLQVLNGIK